MPGRWRVLALLFAARATMGFQFQSVAAMAPVMARDFGLGLADIGLLIGLYLAPGAAIALPGGAIGRRFGDKPAVLAGLVLMALGSTLMGLVPSWHAQIGGRLIAGFGGVMLNVVMTKMVADWFAGREIATAMAIFVNSWPVGVAFALLTLPAVAAVYGAAAAHLVTAAVAALGLAALALLYRTPKVAAEGSPVGSLPSGRALVAIVIVGVSWSLYNVGFATIFSFGPTMLSERGWTVASAGAVVSLALWLAMISVPLGGVIADRTGRHETLLVATLLAFAAALVLATRTAAAIAAFMALGLLSGLPAGPILSLPARVLEPATRSLGMGLFFTVYYIGMFAAPAIAGWLAAKLGDAGAAFDFGAAMLLVCVVLVWTYPRRPPKNAPA